MHILSRVINVIILAIILSYIAAMKMKCGYCTDIPETAYVTTLSTIILIQVCRISKPGSFFYGIQQVGSFSFTGNKCC